MWGSMAVNGWCWVAFMLFVGMRVLNQDSMALRYGQFTLLPFFLVHQPAILVVAYFVVQWDLPFGTKLLAVALGAFALSIALCEFVIKRVSFLRILFGLKARRPAEVEIAPA